jgi:FAD/FMN-containing dehydrogenase
MSITAYAPDDLTVSVTADTTLAALQDHLRKRNQWLPVDPPEPQRMTLGEIVDHNLSGPRRYGHGTIREHLIGIRVQLADGKMIKNGCAVVKNAAGYDLCRLFTGAKGELGTLREATFKVQPLPELERFLEARFPTIETAAEFLEKVDTSVLMPIVLDLHRLDAAGDWTVVTGFAGDHETVEWQCAEMAKLGVTAESSLDYDARFWAGAASAGQPAKKFSVLPSKLVAAIQGLGAGVVSLLVRAGNGTIYYRGKPELPKAALPFKLMEQLRNEFDPQHKLPLAKA